ncbi:MAG: radical SAM protein [Ruminococcus sp.]|nr:radical SAM protein [Ruminococcus sp.]
MSDAVIVIPAEKPIITEECFGALLLATILRENGMDVSIYRYYEASRENGFFDFVEQTSKNILAKNPKIVSFYCRCDYYLTDLQVSRRIKELAPDVCIVMGGPQADVTARETITEIPWVDYCCCGEGEKTIFPLFSGIINGSDVTHIDGLTYRDSQGQVVLNPRPALCNDLDNAPFIDYSFVPESTMKEAVESGRYITTPVGRGCPFNCAYCSTSVFWKRKFRVKSAERIVQEMRRLNSQYGITRFSLDHDLFTANKERLLNFCRVLKESGLDVKWRCSTRVDTIDEEMLDAMIDAGLAGVYSGIESGSPRVQNLIHKKLKPQDMIRVTRMLADNNIDMTASFMYGFPEEMEEDVEHTMRVVYEMMKIGVQEFQFHLCTIMPATEYYQVYRDRLKFGAYTSDQVCDFGVEECHQFITEHQKVFPFYYEYHSELRDKLYGFDNYLLLCLELYHTVKDLDPDRFGDMRLVDLFFEFRDVNIDYVERIKSQHDAVVHKFELFSNYLNKIYSQQDAEKILNVFQYLTDLKRLSVLDNPESDVKVYSVSVKDFIGGKTLREIRDVPSMVTFYVEDGNITVSARDYKTM